MFMVYAFLAVLVGYLVVSVLAFASGSVTIGVIAAIGAIISAFQAYEAYTYKNQQRER